MNGFLLPVDQQDLRAVEELTIELLPRSCTCSSVVACSRRIWHRIEIWFGCCCIRLLMQGHPASIHKGSQIPCMTCIVRHIHLECIHHFVHDIATLIRLHKIWTMKYRTKTFLWLREKLGSLFIVCIVHLTSIIENMRFRYRSRTWVSLAPLDIVAIVWIRELIGKKGA